MREDKQENYQFVQNDRSEERQTKPDDGRKSGNEVLLRKENSTIESTVMGPNKKGG